MMARKILHSLTIFILLLSCHACKQQDSTTVPREKVLRLSSEGEPLTYDPRQARDLGTVTGIHLLYEGLTRDVGIKKPELAAAESYTLSTDEKTYTFKIRPSAWSNGNPLTAYDFEATWKDLLNPDYAAPNAYQLYVIKNGQLAKEGSIELDQVGVHAADASTLIVELEHPTPYFLELLSNHFFYPAHAKMRNSNDPQEVKDLVTNGPFQLLLHEREEFAVVPNPHYWDRQAVKIDKITFYKLDNSTAYHLFQKKELDWAGSPLSTLPVDTLKTLRKSDKLLVKPSAGVHFMRINTQKAPFNDVKLRTAFAYALDRLDLVEHVLQGNQEPAMGFVPPSIMKTPPFFKDHDTSRATSLFNEYLIEHHMTHKNITPITLLYPNDERAHKIAQVAQHQWKDLFNIDIALQSVEGKFFYSSIKNHHYQLALGSWYGDFQGPISFLDIFRYKDNGTNNTEWQNAKYQEILSASDLEFNVDKRKELLTSAEDLLMKEMPIIPLFFNSYNYLHNSNVKGIYFSDLGYLDFKNAEWVE